MPRSAIKDCRVYIEPAVFDQVDLLVLPRAQPHQADVLRLDAKLQSAAQHTGMGEFGAGEDITQIGMRIHPQHTQTLILVALALCLKDGMLME